MREIRRGDNALQHLRGGLAPSMNERFASASYNENAAAAAERHEQVSSANLFA